MSHHAPRTHFAYRGWATTICGFLLSRGLPYVEVAPGRPVPEFEGVPCTTCSRTLAAQS